MNLLDPLPWDSNTPPTFISKDGVKWWLDRDTSLYAHKEDIHGTKLLHVTVWFVAHPDGHKTRLIQDGRDPVFESVRLEDIAVHIDAMKVAARFDAHDPAVIDPDGRAEET